MKIVTAEQMQQIDRSCADIGLPTVVLMENAGKAVAEETRRILGGSSNQHVLVLIGPGNNGGDGLVAGRYLHDWGARVSLYILHQRVTDDPNINLVKERGIALVEAAEDENLCRLDGILPSVTAVIDAIFGTGRIRPLRGAYARVLERVNKSKEENPQLRIIALDLPSGLDADTGAVDPSCLYADNTVTLGFPKAGLFNFPGAERAGRITIADIGIPAYLAEGVDKELLVAKWARYVLPQRPLGANKGSFGRVLAIAGSINYIGAAYLACSGAIKVGAGLVTLATPRRLQPILASKLTEVTYLPLPESRLGIIAPGAVRIIHEQLDGYDVLVVGCGLGQSQPVKRFLAATLFHSRKSLPPLVLDADALNFLAKVPEWWQQIAGDAVITPHPGEMARLTEASVSEVQSDRIGLAQRMAKVWNKTIVLKGAYTVVAAPDGGLKISPVANPGLASAGTGDVLTGAIAGLAAQGLSIPEAAALGVYLHGMAGDRVRERLGDAGMLATDLLMELPLAIRQLKLNLGDDLEQVNEVERGN